MIPIDFTPILLTQNRLMIYYTLLEFVFRPISIVIMNISLTASHEVPSIFMKQSRTSCFFVPHVAKRRNKCSALVASNYLIYLNCLFQPLCE